MARYKLIDSHCHIFSEEFNSDRIEVLNNSFNENIIAIINSSLGSNDIIKTLEKVKHIKKNTKMDIFLSFGFYPTEFNEYELKKTLELIELNIKEIVAIGEVGLDYFYIREHSLREKQKEIFKEFIKLSKTYDIPLIIHSRSAGKYAIDLLIENHAEKVLLHAFDGSFKSAIKGVAQGYFFSIPTSIIYSQQKKKLAEELPTDNILIETDSPVLSPFKGLRNEPKNLIYSLTELSKIKKIDTKELSEIILKNTIKLFNLGINI